MSGERDAVREAVERIPKWKYAHGMYFCLGCEAEKSAQHSEGCWVGALLAALAAHPAPPATAGEGVTLSVAIARILDRWIPPQGAQDAARAIVAAFTSPDVDDLLDEMTQAAESAATAYEHGALSEAKERDKYVRELKAELRAKFSALQHAAGGGA